jgi:hypothetical protein
MIGLRKPMEDIMARLKGITVTTGDGHRGEPFVRVWNNQVSHEREGKHYAFPKPAFFLEALPDARYEVIGQGFLSTDISWRVHIVHEFYNGEGTMEQDLDVIDLRDQVTTRLQGFLPSGCGVMTRISEQPDYDHDNLYHYVVEFMCNFTDTTGSDDARGLYITKQPPTNLTITASEVPTLSTYIPETDLFNIPQS